MRQYVRIAGMIDNEKRAIITFEAGHARKRAARMLAAKLDYEDVTTLLNALLDEKIAKVFPDEMKLTEAEDPKARARKQAKKKSA